MCGLEERQGTQRYSPIAYRVRPTRDCRRTARPVARRRMSSGALLCRGRRRRFRLHSLAAEKRARQALRALPAGAPIRMLSAARLRPRFGCSEPSASSGCRWDARSSAWELAADGTRASLRAANNDSLRRVRIRAFEAILPPKCTSPHIRSADGPLSSDRFASLFRALRAWFEPTSSQVTLELNYLYRLYVAAAAVGSNWNIPGAIRRQ